MNSDFKDLLRLFADFQVSYLVVGGYAVIRYTEPRYTKDLDLWVEATPENSSRCYQALAAFGAPLGDVQPFDLVQEGYVFQMGVPPNRVDLLMNVRGLTFQDAWARRVVIDVEELLLPILCKEDVITSKIASGRPQDLIDVESLRQSEQL